MERYDERWTQLKEIKPTSTRAGGLENQVEVTAHVTMIYMKEQARVIWHIHGRIWEWQ